MKKLMLVMTYLVIWIPSAFALAKLATPNTPQDWHAAKTDLAYDYLRCASLYNLQYAMAKRSGASKQQLAELKQISSNVMKETFGVMRQAKMSKDTAVAAMKMFTNQMMKDMDNRMDNAGVLIPKYGTVCKGMLEDPMARMNYWIKVENKNGERARKRATPH